LPVARSAIFLLDPKLLRFFETDTWTAAVFIDELDTGGFES